MSPSHIAITLPLSDLIACCRGTTFPVPDPARWQALEQEHRHLQALLEQGQAIYGINRRTGHRDDEFESSPESLCKAVLDSHAIGEAPWYDPMEARAITVARLAMWQAGGSAVSPALFQRVRQLLDDPGFRPQIPRQSSYSCGDVIPAAHWARAVLAGTAQIGPQAGGSDIMALINGAFVHAGLALTTLAPLRNAWVLFFENTLALMPCLGNNSFLQLPARSSSGPGGLASQLLRSKLAHLPPRIGTQDPVSLRATDEIFEVLLRSITDMTDRLTEALNTPSTNPLIRDGLAVPVSQASFMLPSLALAQAALINALLFTMWAQVGRTTHLLSGKVSGVPLDGATPRHPLGLIQYPKQMMALLENARFLGGRSIYASGGATSYGVEDLWSHGLTTTDLLKQMAERFLRMSVIEAKVLEALAHAGMLPGLPGGSNPTSAIRPLEIAQQLDQRPDHPRYGFPVPF